MRRVPYLRTLLNQALYLPSLVRLASADVVHVFSASFWSFLLAPVPAMLVGQAFGARVVLHYHSGEADEHLGAWGGLVHPWLRLADEIVVPSDYLAERLRRATAIRTRVIPNVVDLSRFRYRERVAAAAAAALDAQPRAVLPRRRGARGVRARQAPSCPRRR